MGFASALRLGLASLWLAVGASFAQPASAPHDTAAEEVARLIELAVAAVRTEPEAVLQMTNQALAVLAKRPDADLEAQVRVLRCDYFNESDRSAALRELELLRALMPRLRWPGTRAGMLACEGELYEQSGDNTRAMALYEQAVGVAEGARDDRRLAEALFLRGYLRGVLGDYPKGLVDLKRALALYERLNLAVEMRTVANGVASLYNRMGALAEARRQYEDALRGMPAGASRERIVMQYNLGRNHERAQRWDEAQQQFEQVLAHSRELSYVRGEVHALRGLAAVRSAKGDGLRALQLVEEAQRLFGKVPDEPLRARLLVQRAVALRLLHRAGEGMPLLREAIKQFQLGDALADEAEAREELARAAADFGDWRQAYEHLERARKISHDLLQRQIDDRFASIKAQFDSEAKEREFVLLQRENRANEAALAQQRRAGSLQTLAVALAAALAMLLGLWAWRQQKTGRAMRALAMTDELTGLPNRRQALDALQARIDRGGGGAVLILDIDHFKRINDEFGHPAGDEVLRSVARSWTQLLTPEAVLGRLGGEEFVAVLATGGARPGLAFGETLRLAVEALDMSPWIGDRRVTISVGVTELRPGDTLAAVLARADAALYRAKSAGRNRIEVGE